MKVPLLNFVEGPEVPLLNFEDGPGFPLLNFRGIPGPRSQGPDIPGSWFQFYTMPLSLKFSCDQKIKAVGLVLLHNILFFSLLLISKHVQKSK